MDKRWKILSADEAKVESLQNALKINTVLCRILVQRNIPTFERAKEFFRPEFEKLHDPYLMKDMQKAVDRIDAARISGEKILVFGDYDVDGTTAVASMYQFLRNIIPPEKLDFYLPHRYKEGYGVSKKGIDHAFLNGFTLIIALDCGIKSIELIEYAKSLKIDFIVCDHHTPDKILPSAAAILNPKQADCPYPFKDLCGCGVGFKLIQALGKKYQLNAEIVEQNLDLLATAIAADIVSITGENRIMAYYGLKKANENPNPGIKALKMLSGFEKPLHITNLVFLIAPRINAAGRMDDARKAVEMFVADSDQQAMQFAEMLHTDNKGRKLADQTITEEALQMLRSDESVGSKKSTVLYQSHWHKGVVGIVASRLIDHYYRPTIILTQSGEYAAGSARSVVGFNVYEAIDKCRDLLLGYGGHFYAAGITLELDNVARFQERFEEVVASSISNEQLIPEIVIDAEVDFEHLKQSFYNIIYQMEPYGPDNLRPVFITRNIHSAGSKVVKEQHIRFTLHQSGYTFSGIGFNMAEKYSLLNNGPIDIVYTLEENEWNNHVHLQLKIIDFCSSGKKSFTN